MTEPFAMLMITLAAAMTGVSGADLILHFQSYGSRCRRTLRFKREWRKWCAIKLAFFGSFTAIFIILSVLR
jgi:hypothetical protein